MRGLQQAGFVVEHTETGEDALSMAIDETYDAIVLDIGLPGMSGLEVLAAWRANSMSAPVLILTAHGTWSEKVEGLNLGADDYLTKPFHTPELVARLNALVRRSAGLTHNTLSHEDLEMDLSTGRVTRSGQPIDMTALELRMLKYFMTRPGRVIPQSELVEHLYAMDDTRESNTIEVYISRLRRKIGSDRIRTIRGLGYRFG